MKTTLELAIRAKLPMVSVTTDDPLNVDADIEALSAGRPVHQMNPAGLPSSQHVYWASSEKFGKEEFLDKLLHAKTTLVLVNVRSDLALDCGPVPVNMDRLVQSIARVDPLADMGVFMPLVRGLTVKQAATCCELAFAQNFKLTGDGVREMRLHLYGKQVGLEFVSPAAEGLYVEPPELKAWLDVNGPYFGHPKLSPRGLLFSGAPGTGKTLGAKYVARRLGVPMHRLDLASVLGKYVGESEARLRDLLATVDRESPCLLLIDESEKLFKSSNDSGVTERLLSQLLWWLQEHTAPVLTVMTTNDHDKMPPELFRKGRIDATIHLNPLSAPDAHAFCLKYAKEVFNVGAKQLVEAMPVGDMHVKTLPSGEWTYASLTSFVDTAVKMGRLVAPTTKLRG